MSAFFLPIRRTGTSVFGLRFLSRLPLGEKCCLVCKLTRFRTGLDSAFRRLRRLPYGNDIIVRYARFPRLLLFTAAIYRRCTTSLCTPCEYTCLGSTHGRGNARSFGFTVDYIINHRRPVADYSWRAIATSLPHQTHTCSDGPTIVSIFHW